MTKNYRQNKITSYILILLALVGICSQAIPVSAQSTSCTPPQVLVNGVCITQVTPSGRCTVGNNSTLETQARCTQLGGSWVQIGGTQCMPPNTLVNGVCITQVTPSGKCTVGNNPPTLESQADCTKMGGSWVQTSGTPTNPAQPGSNEPSTSTYTLLEPIGTMGPTFDAGDDKALGNYLNIMIRIFIGICAILAMIMIVLGGIEYMTSELVSSKESGKERITNAIFGLLLALGSYALLNTINPDLLIVEPNIPAATLIVLGEDIPQVAVNGKYTAPGISYNTGTVWTSVGAVPTLPARVVPIPAGDCTSVGQQRCTSLRGFDFTIVNYILANCPTCTISITGGTEFWLHSTNTTHKPGSSTMDFRASDALNNFITGSNSFPTGKTITKNGIKFWAEEARGNQPAHWHAYQ